MKRKIKNYTTGKPAHETIAEIQRMLAEAGAIGIAMEFNDDHRIKAFFFKMKIDEKEVPFKLPAKPEAVYKVLFAGMLQEKQHGKRRREKSLDIAWRIVRDWLDVQIAMTKLEQTEMGQIFFGYLLMENNKTLYEVSKESQFSNLLPSGKEKNGRQTKG